MLAAATAAMAQVQLHWGISRRVRSHDWLAVDPAAAVALQSEGVLLQLQLALACSTSSTTSA